MLAVRLKRWPMEKLKCGPLATNFKIFPLPFEMKLADYQFCHDKIICYYVMHAINIHKEDYANNLILCKFYNELWFIKIC